MPSPPTVTSETPPSVSDQSVQFTSFCANATPTASSVRFANNFHLTVAVTLPIRSTTPSRCMNLDERSIPRRIASATRSRKEMWLASRCRAHRLPHQSSPGAQRPFTSIQELYGPRLIIRQEYQTVTTQIFRDYRRHHRWSRRGAAVDVGRAGDTARVSGAVHVAGGAVSVAALRGSGDAVHFVCEAFKHAKAISAAEEGADFLAAAGIIGAPDARRLPSGVSVDEGATLMTKFLCAVSAHRCRSFDSKAMAASMLRLRIVSYVSRRSLPTSYGRSPSQDRTPKLA